MPIRPISAPAKVTGIVFNREVVKLYLTEQQEHVEVTAIDFQLQNGVTIRPMELVRKIEGQMRTISEDSSARPARPPRPERPGAARGERTDTRPERPGGRRGGRNRPQAGGPTAGQPQAAQPRPPARPQPAQQLPTPENSAEGEAKRRQRRRRRGRGGRGPSEGGEQSPPSTGE